MSHELTIRKNGQIEFCFAGDVPWHGLGIRLNERVSPMRALQEAGLDWTVGKTPAYAKVGDAYVEIPYRFATVRMDTGTPMGTVGPQWTPIQNREQAEFLEALAGEGGVQVECAGSIYGGCRTFWTCKLKDEIQVAEHDKVKEYLVLCNGHDGSTAFRAYWTPIRVVCRNTLEASLSGEKRKTGFVIRHSSGVKQHVAEARRTLKICTEYYDLARDAYQGLAAKRVTEAQYHKVLALAFPDPDPEVKNKEQAEAKVAFQREQVTNNLRLECKALDKKNVSAWDVWNAFTFYASHQLDITAKNKVRGGMEKHFDRVVFGAGHEFRQRTLQLVNAL